MKLKEYFERLQNMIDANPEILEYDVVYSSDSEGNDFNLVGYNPSIGLYDEEDWVKFQSYDTLDDGDTPNAVCVN